MSSSIFTFLLELVLVFSVSYSRGHYVTLLSGFKPDFHLNGLKEIAPLQFVQYIENFTDWDLVGSRYAHKAPLSVWKALRYPAEVIFICVWCVVCPFMFCSPHPFPVGPFDHAFFRRQTLLAVVVSKIIGLFRV